MEKIKTRLTEVIRRAFGVEFEPEVTEAPEETGADFASNVAMKLAKVAYKSPMMIAEEIKQNLSTEEWVTEVAAPGFLNFRMRDEYFADKVQQMAGGVENIISPDEYLDKTVVTEFSDPNPFKVLHVGHLYTSIVGDSISRLLEFAGARVVRTNFGGDVGLHVAKTLWAVKRNNYSSDDITIEKIAVCYVEGTKAYEEDEAAKAEIVRLNKVIYAIAELGLERSQERLEIEQLAEDFECSTAEMMQIAQLYWQGRSLSYAYFRDFYARIGVKFDRYYPESTVAGRGLREVREHTGSVYEQSDGAVVYRGEKEGLHTRVFINREGLPTYEAKDVGLIFTKWDDYHFDESAVITGNEQSDYMKVVLVSVHEYAPELVERTQHLTHGMVKLQGNVKMSSRKGNFLKAVDVLEMVKAALGEDSDEKIALAAIKYAFLRYRVGGDIVFDPAESVSMTGNSGVYLLYSAVRAKKVLQKVVENSKNPIENGEKLNKKFIQAVENSVEKSDFERKLNKKIVQYGDILEVAIAEKTPYKICGYLYELAQEFSRFYEHVPVAGAERETELTEVVKAYLVVMEHGLGLLGIEIPEKM